MSKRMESMVGVPRIYETTMTCMHRNGIYEVPNMRWINTCKADCSIDACCLISLMQLARVCEKFRDI